MMNINFRWPFVSAAVFAVVLLGGCGGADSTPGAIRLLNVSYDPTRELYRDINQKFSQYYKTKTGKDVEFEMSHGGSGKQARSVIDGLEADVVTLALAQDIDAISKAGLIEPGWQGEFKHNSSPYTSTVVFLVRKGNPKRISGWEDLVKPGVKVVMPNPKTGGGARWNFLAAWTYALKQPGGNEAKAKAFVTQLFKNVPILDSGARGATTTFVERKFGDVLVTWENEAFLTQKKLGAGNYEIVWPKQSIHAEPPVAIVDTYAKKHGTEAVAKAYLDYLYTPEAQELEAKYFYRPLDPAAAVKVGQKFPPVQLWTLEQEFGSWDKAQAKFFADGAIFDQIYQPR